MPNLLGILKAAALLTALAGCGPARRSEPPAKSGAPAPAPLARRPDQRLIGLNLSSYNGGRLRYQLSAPSGVVQDKIRQVEVAAFSAKVFDAAGKKGSPSSVISAGRGILMTDTENMEAHENAVVRSLKSETTLYAGRITWDSRARLFRSLGPVRQVKPGQTVRGTGMEANEDLSRVRIRQAMVAREKPYGGKKD